MSAPARRRYRTILYWRPLVPGLNDTDAHVDRAHALSLLADATVFTGLFYRDQIARYYQASGLPEPYDATARRKIVPETLERRVLAAFAGVTTARRSDGRTRQAMSDWRSCATPSPTWKATASDYPTWSSWPSCRSRTAPWASR